MKQAPLKLREFAARLIKIETAGGSPVNAPPAIRVCEKLRSHLIMLMGGAGFRALLSRALAMGSADDAWLRTLRVRADGSLEETDPLALQNDPASVARGSITLLGQLLELLMAFIGENLTVRLVHDVWPELSLDGLNSDTGGKNEKTK